MDEFDIQLKEAIARRQAGQEASQNFQMPQGQMVGGRYIRPSLGQALVQGLRMYQGQKDYEQAGQQIKDLTANRQKAIADALRQFGEASQGTPENAPGDGVGPVMPAKAPDMMGAYQRLLEAPDAGLRNMAVQGMASTSQAQAKARMDAADRQRVASMLATMTPQQAIAAGAPADVVKAYAEAPNLGRTKVSFKDVGRTFVPVDEYGVTPENIKPLQKTGNPFSDLLVTDSSGNIAPNMPLIGAKSTVARAGKSTVTVNNKGPEAFDIELAKLDAKQLDQWRDKSEQARSSLATVQRLRSAEAQGAYSGGLADQKLAAASLINGITGIEPKGLVGSQLYNAEASKLVFEHIKGLGANPSNADREFIEKTVPRLATSKEARTQMANFIEGAAHRTIATSDSMDKFARQNRSLGGFEFSPVPNGLPDQTAIDAELARRSRGGK